MSRTITVSSAAAAIAAALAGTAFAQPPGITPEMINTTLPLEGAPLAEPGPYEVTSGPAFGEPGLMAFHPADLAAFPARDTLPVLVWGNGGCAINSTRYAGFLTTIASHGFVVMATAAQPDVNRATADHLRAAIAWAETENKRAGSPLSAPTSSTVGPNVSSRIRRACPGLSAGKRSAACSKSRSRT